MHSFFSRKQKDRLNLIIDIQSSVVRGAMILSSKGGLPKVVWTTSTDIPYRAGATASHMIDTTVKAIEHTALLAHTFIKDKKSHVSLPEKITRVHCILSSPWIISQAKTVGYNFDKETRVNKAHVNHIVKTERESMVKKGSLGMVGIEEKIFDVRLNEYSIPKWQGASCVSFEVSFAICLASKNVIQRFIKGAKMSGVGISSIDFHSSLLLQHIGLCSALTFNDPYILAHVHGELTDIVVTSGQSCILFGSHPTGVRSIVRQVANSMNITEAAADSALTLYEHNQLDPLHGSNDTERIKTVLDKWNNDCKSVTDKIPDRYKPTKAIVSARVHEKLFKNSFIAAHPELKTDVLPNEEIFDLVEFGQDCEKLRLTILYVVAIHNLEAL